jgi:ribosomal protein S18 acetylase RimI-like enzyme
MIQVFIRRPDLRELESVRALVQTVVTETYGGLWTSAPLPIDPDCWDRSWIAVADAGISNSKIADSEVVDENIVDAKIASSKTANEKTTNEKIVGVALTDGEWLDDLWVLRDSRRCGVGRRLLAQAEAEIMARGHDTLRLRVVASNEGAVAFYRRHGWQIAREFPHEKFPITMLEMFKPVRRDTRKT